jgi:hypothetical protein
MNFEDKEFRGKRFGDMDRAELLSVIEELSVRLENYVRAVDVVRLELNGTLPSRCSAG